MRNIYHTDNAGRWGFIEDRGVCARGVEIEYYTLLLYQGGIVRRKYL